MRNEIVFNPRENIISSFQTVISKNEKQVQIPPVNLPGILFLTSYPPRECGIATYSQDLIKALHNKFLNSFSVQVCALESGNANHTYPDEVKYILDTNDPRQYSELAHYINDNEHIEIVLVQHEFGFFHLVGEDVFLQFLYSLTKPIIIVFHTILPRPNEALKEKVQQIMAACASVVVMTKNSAQVLIEDYSGLRQKISVITHGTHLVPHLNKTFLKKNMH